MKLIVVLLAAVALAVAEELDHNTEHKKRGVAKSPSSINSLSSNGHQKPEQLTYQGYQQPSATQTPLYPLAPPSYTSSDAQQPVTHQPMFSFVPQQPILPVSYYPFAQQFAMPKYQVVAMKSANGQTQFTLVPQQNIYMPPQAYNPAAFQFQQPILSNHLASQQTPTSSSSSAYHSSSSTSQNPYSTPQSQTYSTQSTSTPNFLSSQSIYSHPSHLGFGQSSLSQLSQPSTMFLFAQPAPQLYNNYAPQQNLLYSQQAQQLLNYYHSNPAAKNQLLYGNSAGYQPSQVNSYQNPISVSDYEKISPVQQSLTSQKSENDLNLNTNEFVSQSDTQFRPIASYGSRSQTTYKSQ